MQHSSKILKAVLLMGSPVAKTTAPWLRLPEKKAISMTQDQLYEGIWVDYYDAMFPYRENASRAKLVIDLIKMLKPDAKLMLELACGTGNYTIYWKKHFKVKATDISPDMIARAIKKCSGVDFEAISMTAISEPPVYDVVTCMWESFRYLESYGDVDRTIQRIHSALKPKGLFVVDFHHFPAKQKWFELKFKELRVGEKKIQETQQLITEGDYDVRKSVMTVQNGEAKKVEIKRSPFLRISEQQMKGFLEAAGFTVVHFSRNFVGPDESMLFIGQKKEK